MQVSPASVLHFRTSCRGRGQEHYVLLRWNMFCEDSRVCERKQMPSLLLTGLSLAPPVLGNICQGLPALVAWWWLCAHSVRVCIKKRHRVCPMSFCVRCVAESNRPSWFCRPETKPLIQRTVSWTGVTLRFLLCGCKGSKFFWDRRMLVCENAVI